MKALEGLPKTVEVELDRDGLKVVGIDRQQIPELIAQLAAAGVRIFSVTAQEPSLEDIYFSLHQKSAATEKEAS